MSINVATVDLSAAHTPDQAVPIQINRPSWIRFHRVPQEVNVRLDTKGSTSFPVDQPFTIKFCGQAPAQIFVDNEAGAGTLVILYGDATQELDDFLASGGSSGGDWEVVDVLVPHSVAVMPNAVSPNLGDGTQGGAVGGFAYMRAVIPSLAVPITRLQFGSAAGAAAAEYFFMRGPTAAGRNHASFLDYLFQPLGVTREKSQIHSFKTELAMIGRAVIGGGNVASFGFGYLGRVAGTEIFGVGMFIAPAITGHTRFMAGVLDYAASGLAWPVVGQRIIWQDTGIDFHNFRGVIGVEFGQEAGDPYISFQADGDEVYRHDGEYPASMGLPAAPNGELSEGLKLYKNTAADEIYCHMLSVTNSIRRA